MGAPHDLDGLIRFIRRDDIWRERMADVLAEHLAPAMEEFEVGFEEIGEILGESWPMVSIERFAFYERAKQAYCVIQTGERRFYGCFAFRKGVIGPED